VIAASSVDFEEFGVDQTTLDEMRQVSDSLAAARPSHLPFIVAAPQSRPILSSLFHVFFSFVDILLIVCAAFDDGAMAAWLGG